MKRKRQNKDGSYWFRCESQWKYGKDACTIVAVREADLKTHILTVLHKQAEAILGRYITIEKTAAAPDNSAAELREINQRMDKDGRMLRSLYLELEILIDSTRLRSKLKRKIILQPNVA